MAWRKSPFELKDAEQDESSFFDRDSEFQEIRNNIGRETGWLWAVSGPRRIGKTSILRKCEREFKALTNVTYLDIATDVDSDAPDLLADILGKILRGWGSQVARGSEIDVSRFVEETAKLRAGKLLPFLVILDEIEVLRYGQPMTLIRLLRAFRDAGPRNLHALLGNGWRLGDAPARSLDELAQEQLDSGFFKNVRQTEINPFAESTVRELLGTGTKGVVHEFSYSPDAIDAVVDLTHGHPLFFCAINDAIYKSRQLLDDRSEIQPGDAYAAAEAIISKIRNQFDQLWRWVTPLQTRLARLVADLTWDPSLNRFLGDVPMAALVAALDAPHSEIRVAAETLAQNWVLTSHENDPTRWKLFAPALGYWLRSKDVASTIAASQPRLEIYLAAARSAIAARQWIQFQTALAQIRAIEASNPDALLLEAEANEAQGYYREAARSLRLADRNNATGTLAAFLERRLLSNPSLHDPFEDWYGELEVFAPARTKSSPIQQARSQYHANAWVKHFEDQDLRAAGDSLEVLLSLSGIRSEAEFLQEFAQSVARQLSQCHAWKRYRAGFWLLEHAVLPLRHMDFGAPAQVAALRAELTGRVPEVTIDSILSRLQPTNVLWEDVVSFLDLGANPPWDESGDLPALAINTYSWGLLVRAAPTHLLKRMREAISLHLLQRLRCMIERDSQDAAQTIEVLCEMGNPPHDGIWAAVQEAVERLGAAGDADFLQFFGASHKVFTAWIGSVTEDYADEVLNQIGLVADRLWKKGGSSTSGGAADLQLRSGTAYQEWIRLLESRSLRRLPRAAEMALRLTPAADVQAQIRGHRHDAGPKWETEVRDALGETYEGVELLPFRLHGMHPELARIYRAVWDDQPVHLKVYRFGSLDDRHKRLRELLDYLWENETRALRNLGSLGTAQSLVKLKFIDDGIEGLRVVVTEGRSDRTLKRALQTSPRLFDDDEAIWREVHRLVEAVAAMHGLGILHRNIRPANIFVETVDGATGFELRLAGFEWSVHLHALAERNPPREELDYYSAPEALRVAMSSSTILEAGESFATDVFALGLTLFELTVRRLEPSELSAGINATNYSQAAHRKWISGLHREIAEAPFAQRGTENKREFLRWLLQPEPHLRPADLTLVADRARQLAIESSRLHRTLNELGNPPTLGTTLFRQSEDRTAGQSSSIERHITEVDPHAQLGTTTAHLEAYLKEQFRSATVYANARSSAPLFVKTKGKVNYVLSPWTDKKHPGEKSTAKSPATPRPPFVTVARDQLGDAPQGPALVVLNQVRFMNTKDVMKEDGWTQPLEHAKAWQTLFETANSPSDGRDLDQRQFHTFLEQTLMAERALWNRQVTAYTLEGTPVEEAGRIVITIAQRESTDTAKSESLERLVAKSVARERPYFELRHSPDALAPPEPSERWWRYESFGPGGRVRLSRRKGTEVPRANGFIRSTALGQNRAVYDRRRNLLRLLRDDRYFLTALTDLAQVRTRQPRPPEIRFNESQIDENKQQVAKRIFHEPPLFVVQGPPGTGKTTLAAAVIQNYLRLHPSARILIVSQAHEPLNNLMLRVAKDFSTLPERERPSIVRLLSHFRALDSDESVQKFLPSELVKGALKPNSWTPLEGSALKLEAKQDWRNYADRPTNGMSAALEQRLIDSASLVFTTANDRSLSVLRADRTFDLMIFEEAARAYPLEVLAAMRTSRQWLLIGDQQQLSPFAIDDIKDELKLLLSRNDLGRWDGDTINYFDFLFKGKCFAGGAPPRPRSADDPLARIPSARLTNQWRMHPEIGDLMRKYYPDLINGDGRNRREMEKRLTQTFDSPECPEFLRHGHATIWIDVPHASKDPRMAEVPASGGGFTNPAELFMIERLIYRIQNRRQNLGRELVFLAPYRAQVNRLNDRFRNWENRLADNRIEFRDRAFTIDQFQGRQANIVIVSLVRNNNAVQDSAREESTRGSGKVEISPIARIRSLGFLDQAEGMARTGVMCSRAQKLLIIVGSKDQFLQFGEDFHLSKVINNIGTIEPARELGYRIDELTKYLGEVRELPETVADSDAE